jgi:hypothetical protein
MANTITNLEFYVLLEPFSEQLELHSPLFELILNAPLQKIDKDVDINAIKKDLDKKLSTDEKAIFNQIIEVLCNPSKGYNIEFQIGKKLYINEIYERDNQIVEYLFKDKTYFSLEPPKTVAEKIQSYTELLDISNYQLDFVSPKHQLTYDEYVVLNLCFQLEEESRIIGILENGKFCHFSSLEVEDLLNSDAYQLANNLTPLFRDNETIEDDINIDKTIQSLLGKGYLNKIDEPNFTIGSQSIALFENLFTQESLKFSISGLKFDEDDIIMNYAMFRVTKNSIFLFTVNKRDIHIEILANKATIQNKLQKIFSIK